MSVMLKAGARLRSNVDSTEVVVVKGAGEVDLRCGGAAMVPSDQATSDGAPAPGFDGGTFLGKRYASPDGALELLCVKAGAGSLSLGETLIAVKEAKQMPASD